MKLKFGFERYADFDFFHSAYGRGAIIFAIRKIDGEPMSGRHGQVNDDYFVAKVFHEVADRQRPFAPGLNPVHTITEDGKLVRMTIGVSLRENHAQVVKPIEAVIERIIPSRCITFEVVRENHSMRPQSKRSNPENPADPACRQFRRKTP